MDLAKRFSLDYLISGSKGEASQGNASDLGASAMKQSIQITVAPVLRELEKAPDQSKSLLQLYQVVKPALQGIGFDGFRDVIGYMVELNLVKVAQVDPQGNNLIQKA